MNELNAAFDGKESYVASTEKESMTVNFDDPNKNTEVSQRVENSVPVLNKDDLIKNN